MLFARVTLVGCGLIGGSFAMALRAAGEVGEIVGFDRNPVVAARAVDLGIADRCEARLEDAVIDADLVLLAVPVARTAEVLAAIAPRLRADAIVTDVGSTKQSVIAVARTALGAAIARFVPGHPIAGREIHGPGAALVDLFRGRRVLLTPLPENDEDVVVRVEAAWIACGARVDRIDAAAHDAVLSAVSHLPHLLAYALVAQIAEAPDADLKFSLSGGGFRDFTRIAASSPEMWRDVAIANRDALLKDLDAYRSRLDVLRQWVADRDAESLEAMFVCASTARTRLADPR